MNNARRYKEIDISHPKLSRNLENEGEAGSAVALYRRTD